MNPALFPPLISTCARTMKRGHQDTSEQMSAPGGSEENKLPNHQEQHHGSHRRSDGMQQQQQHREGKDFAAQEAAMRAASAARWAKDERFNLKNAFGLQLQRLEVKLRWR